MYVFTSYLYYHQIDAITYKCVSRMEIFTYTYPY